MLWGFKGVDTHALGFINLVLIKLNILPYCPTSLVAFIL